MFKITARTILELGAELISSDVIAFYELIKNAIDADSKTGAEINLHIVLRRNDYLRIRASALESIQDGLSGNERNQLTSDSLDHLKGAVARSLDVRTGPDAVREFAESVSHATDREGFVLALDEAYRTQNWIKVSDTGSGMSLQELKDNYLTIGTPSRKKVVESVMADGGSKSPYLGEKGIGRLSVMRLGDSLFLETARASDLRLNTLKVDWRAFGDLDAMIEDVPVKAELGAHKPGSEWSGTVLTIGNLSEDWTEKRIREMVEYDFARLTDPFVDQKRRPRIAVYWNGVRIAIPSMAPELIQNAHARFTGEYIAKGADPHLKVTLEAISLGGFKHPREVDVVTLALPDLEGLLTGLTQDVPISALTSVGNFSFEGYWYNRRYLSSVESIGNQKVVRELQRKWAGILLFRDGYRVFPYGDDEDDWLGLDRRALGRPGYVLNKAQFVGHVQISRMQNPGLVDQTNREGLRATPEQRTFVSVLQHVVREMLWDFFRDIDRRYRTQPLDLGDVKVEVKKLEARAKMALSRVRRFVPREEVGAIDELQQAFQEFQDLSIRAQQRIEEVEADGRQMVQMAGVGLMVEVVAHELARATESALEAIEALRGKDMPTEIKARLETLRAEMKSVSKRLRILDELSVSGRQRSEIFDLGELVQDLKEGHSAQFKRHGLEFMLDRPKKPLRVRLVKGMVVQILENLISNSLYWTAMRAERESRYVPSICVELETDPPTIRFRDNGRGISPEHRERIFRPFWSLKEKNKRRGLGLFIARENANYLGGRLMLSERTDKDSGRLHEFVLELPQSATQL